MTVQSIPWASPHYWGNEEQYVLDALKSNWISGGKYVDKFETDLSKFCKSSYSVTASNGTTALHMALLASGIGEGDEVIVPGFAFMAAANVTLHLGAKPVFTEVNSDTWCMDVENIEKCISKKTKAIVPVHTYGNVCIMDSINQLAEMNKILVVEDAAESFGSTYKGRMSGTCAKLGTFSFHATKTITTGEGGAVVTDDIELNNGMRLYRNHGMSKRRYWHDVIGHNFRLTNLQAAIGCAQLEMINKIMTERERVYLTYKEFLKNIDGISFQVFPKEVNPVVWAVALNLHESAFPQGRDTVIEQLQQIGVETRPGFYSASMMSHIYGDFKLPICEKLSQQIISLPSSPILTNGDIEHICSNLVSLKK